MWNSRSTHSIRTAFVLVALAAVFLTQAQSARAQGTMGTLPDPMTSRELDGYADRLGLSAEQRRAIGRFYEQYHERFRALRDGEIADFLNAMQQMQRSGTQFPDRQEMERFMGLWDRARSRIRMVDDQFFDMIQVALTEDQMAMVDRVRMARERQRYRGDLSFGMAAAVQDLSETLMRMNLTPEESERIDPLLADYERQLTSHMRRQSEAGSRLMIDMYDSLEAIGFSEEAMADPEEMARLMGEMQAITMQLFARMGKSTHELRLLNYRTYRALVNLLDQQRQRAFRDAFTRGTFTELHFIAHSDTSNRFEAVLSFEELDESLRRAISEAQRAFETERDGVFQRALRFASENYRSPMAAMFGGEPDAEYDTRLAELQEQALRVESQGRRALRELLPSELEDQVAERTAETMRNQYVERTTQFGTVVQSTQVESAAYEPLADPFVPGPISARDILIYADLLELDENGRVLLEQLHAEYIQRFEQETANVLSELSRAKQEQWQWDPESSAARPADPQHIAAVYDLRRKAMSATIAQDEAFFDDLELVLVDVSLERARLNRARNRYAAASRMSMSGDHGGGYADLADVVRHLNWDAARRMSHEQSLLDWERAMAEITVGYFDAMMANDEAHERFFSSMQSMMQDQDMSQWQDFAERRREALSPYQRRLRDIRTQMREVTESTREAIASRLSGEDAARFIDAYKRRAFPHVYNDRRAIHTQFRRALNLPDLAHSSREAMMELNLTYNARYHDLTERMVQLRQQSRGTMAELLDETDMADYLDEESSYSRLTFERDELNAWAIRELRGLLTESQRDAIGPLP